MPTTSWRWNAGWDDELLAIEFSELADAGFDNLLTGFTRKTDDALTPGRFLKENGQTRTLCPEVQAEPVSKLGDVWIIRAKYRLMCGDSTNAVHLAPASPGQPGGHVADRRHTAYLARGRLKDKLKDQDDEDGRRAVPAVLARYLPHCCRLTVMNRVLCSFCTPIGT